ncbi:class I adenylate-forming enzyme family protein [Slackia isoflavoniconvertens]|uniref:class I adenylate-forming enzyme family protein n=1 Tax=Slackia isoflavoniconvertens TaxID=572010 RepID=UPI003CCC565D
MGGHSWLLSCLSAGAAVVVASKFDAEEILGKIEQYAVTHIILLPPSVYCRLSREAAPGARDLSSVRIVQSAAGAMTPSIVEGIFQLFPACEINYGWGQSESGVGTSMRLSREEYASGTPKIHSVGVPMRSLEMMLLDEKGGASDCGEAVVRTPAMMEGYYERPDLTREVLQDGWLRTGDVFARDEQGLYYFKARVKDVIKTGGENVYASEVQAVILSHPEVQDCVVKGVPDLVWGEAVAAIVQPMKGSALSPKAIQDFCKRHLASYKKPQKIGLVDDLGRDESGKVGADRMNELFSLAES